MLKRIERIVKSEQIGGVLLLSVTALSLILANSAWGEGYIAFWDQKWGGLRLVDWINDGLMTLFFLLIGLELKMEVLRGELSDLKKAALPIFGALGGMVVPALIYYGINRGSETVAGVGIPMATDIAFAIGVLSLLGKRVPLSLKIFLTALAVIDDLGAILVIALFYSGTLSWIDLAVALAILMVLFRMNKRNITALPLYLIGGAAMWFFLHRSGIHATIAGVLIALSIPLRSIRRKSLASILRNRLHQPVTWVVLPLFAAANTCVSLGSDWIGGITSSSGLGILTGLTVGKPVGIVLFTGAASLLGWAALPSGIRWRHLFGTGILAGIGFTMSIFITLLAFDRPELVNDAKIAVLTASILSGTIGFLFLRGALSETPNGEENGVTLPPESDCGREENGMCG